MIDPLMDELLPESDLNKFKVICTDGPVSVGCSGRDKGEGGPKMSHKFTHVDSIKGLSGLPVASYVH